MNKKVLFLLPYPLNRAPSQRFRVEAFFSLLEDNKIVYRTHEFLDESAWLILYQRGSLGQKVFAVVKGFLKRLCIILFIAPKYSYIFIHREAAPLGPPIYEWLLAKIFKKKIVYDFDDAIWIPAVTESNKVVSYAKWFSKIRTICKWSYKISAGNTYLAEWSMRYNQQVFVIPTSVDIVKRFNRVKFENEVEIGRKRNMQYNSKVVVGWTGSHSTLKYLDFVIPVLQRLEREFDFQFLVICNQSPTFYLKCMRFIEWQEANEIEDLMKMDIGIMPLYADDWSEGKCGFKLIQYLSLGIPAVASSIGVNKKIIEEGKNGFLCDSENEWYEALKQLITNTFLRYEMGRAGKQKIERQYSIQANAGLFLNLFS